MKDEPPELQELVDGLAKGDRSDMWLRPPTTDQKQIARNREVSRYDLLRQQMQNAIL